MSQSSAQSSESLLLSMFPAHSLKNLMHQILGAQKLLIDDGFQSMTHADTG